MPRPDPSSFVLPSLIDRLIEDKTPTSGDATIARLQDTRQLRAAVRRDLEWLLNTRCTAPSPGEEMQDVQSSVYCFGLPDFSSLTANSGQDRARMIAAMQRAIEQFEPRLGDVSVTPVEDGDSQRRVMRFLVTGLLLTEPAPEQVSFDTVLELGRGEYRVRDQ
jgi:type VI secretion system protein ImpF